MKDRNMEGFFFWKEKWKENSNFCLTCSSPWLVHDISEYSHSIVVAHVLKVNVVHLREKIRRSITDLLLLGRFKISHNYSS